MASSHFSVMPNINIGRTRWNMTYDRPTTFQHGRLIPLDAIPVLPGDTFKLTLSSLIRMSTPIAPIMDNIRANIYAFFVPMRLVWEHTKEFFGENTTTAGPQLTSYYIPRMNYGTALTKAADVGSIAHYLGKPYIPSAKYFTSEPPKVSVLKERGYLRCFNEWFRAEQFQDPILVSMADTGDISSSSFTFYDNTTTNFADWTGKVLPVCKQFDYFTSATLSPQYGPSVEVPLGDYAPLGLLYDNDDYAVAYQPYEFDKDNKIWYDDELNGHIVFGRDGSQGNLHIEPDGSSHYANLGYVGNTTAQVDFVSGLGFKTNIVANLTNATAASINTLRAAFAAQRFLERSNFGTRYNEYLKAHFGVNPPTGLLQMTELIGEHHFNINIQQVLSTADASDSSTTKLGQPGANSTTGDKCVLFKKGFVEHGFVFIMLSTTHDRHYTQGFLREDLKADMLEIYHPEFATLGDQSIKSLEIYANKDMANVDGVFGYQEHWAEYRYRPSRATGLLDPNVPNSLSYWTLTDTFSTEPDLGSKFLQEDRSALSRALVTGVNGPDFVGDFYFDFDVVRPMPLYSMSGRIDHVGGW